MSRSFNHQMAVKTSWHRSAAKIRHCHPMYIDLIYDVIHEIFVLFTFAQAKVKVIWCDNLVFDQSLQLLNVLHISYISHQTLGLKLKLGTLVSAKDKVTRSIYIILFCNRSVLHWCILQQKLISDFLFNLI